MKQQDEEKYQRVSTTLYKIVKRPLLSGDFIEERRPWNYETLRQDHSKDYISQIEKYDGFCSVPDHINYQRSIGKFLNQYEPINYQPSEGGCTKTIEFLSHIFEEQLEMGLDYLQLLYLKPLQRLPVLLLVSKERNTDNLASNKREQIIVENPIKEQDGLKDYELSFLFFAISNQISDEALIPLYSLLEKMNKAGYNDAAVSIAVRKLVGKGYLTTGMDSDWNNNEFLVCSLTPKGVSYIMDNENLFELKLEKVKVEVLHNTNTNDLPF